MYYLAINVKHINKQTNKRANNPSRFALLSLPRFLHPHTWWGRRDLRSAKYLVLKLTKKLVLWDGLSAALSSGKTIILPLDYSARLRLWFSSHNSKHSDVSTEAPSCNLAKSGKSRGRKRIPRGCSTTFEGIDDWPDWIQMGPACSRNHLPLQAWHCSSWS